MFYITSVECLRLWIREQVVNATASTLPIYVGQFKSMWIEQFDTLDNIPSDIENLIEDRYRELGLGSK